MSGSKMRVVEVHGGTAGTDYMYLIISNEVIHISQLNGCRKVGERRRSGGRREVVWEAPDHYFRGSEGLYVSFTRRGRYPSVILFKMPHCISSIHTLSPTELYNRGLIVGVVQDPIRQLVEPRGLSFRLFGPEVGMLAEYRMKVPRLVEDLWSTLRRLGVSEVLGHMERAIEVLRGYRLAEFMSLILPTPQGRVRSLHEKLTRAYELWLLSKVLEAASLKGYQPTSTTIWLESTTNHPALTMKRDGLHLYALYQPSIVPHIASALVNGLGKPLHAVPDIALLTSSNQQHIAWGELVRYANSVVLLIEAKLSLSGATVYESVDTAIRQVYAYRQLLGNRPSALVAIHDDNAAAAYKLRVHGVDAIDGLNPVRQDRVDSFIDYVMQRIP